MSIADHLATHPVLTVLSPEALAELAVGCELRSYGRGDSVRPLVQGESAILLVVEGSLSVTRRNRERGVSILMGLFRAPAILTETELGNQGQWASVVRAAQPSKVVFVPSKAFSDLAASDVRIAAALYKDACARQQMLTRLVELLGAEDVAFRLLALLWASQPSAKRAIAAEGAELVSPPVTVSKSRLANALGVHRKTIARHMIALENAGMIRTKGRTIAIDKNAPRIEVGEYGMGATWGLLA